MKTEKELMQVRIANLKRAYEKAGIDYGETLKRTYKRPLRKKHKTRAKRTTNTEKPMPCDARLKDGKRCGHPAKELVRGRPRCGYHR